MLDAGGAPLQVRKPEELLADGQHAPPGGEVIGLGWTRSQVNRWGVPDPGCRRLYWPFSWGSRVTVWKWQGLPLVNL